MSEDKLYCIRRRFGESPHFFRDARDDGRFVAAFPDRAEAEAHLHALELGERRTRTDVNPFRYCAPRWQGWDQPMQRLAELTSLDEPRLCDWILDAGLTPPRPEGPGWAQRPWDLWWQRGAAAMTDLQRQRVWEALDKVSLFELVEVAGESPPREAGRKVFVVQRREWRFNDRWVAYEPGEDQTLLAFTDRDKALAYRDRLARELGLTGVIDPRGDDACELVVVEIDADS